MSKSVEYQALLTYPSPTRDAPRGIAHLMWFGKELIALGELDDNPGEDIIGSIEIIVAGLIHEGRATRATKFLHYLPCDHVSGGASAVWQIVWRARAQDGTPLLAKPTWEPVEEDFASTAVERDVEVVNLLEPEDLAQTLNDSLGQRDSEYLWQEVAELAFGPGSQYMGGCGRVEDVVGLAWVGLDRWNMTARLFLRVERGDSDVPEDVVDVHDYEVTFEIYDDAFPEQMRNLVVAG